MIDVKRLIEGRVFGDRVLIKRLVKPTKARGLFIPEAYAKQGKKGGTIWWGVVAAFGLDSFSEAAHGLTAGDIVGIEPIGNHYAEFVGDDGETYVWVPEEHLAIADQGTVAAWQKGELDAKAAPEFRVLGARVLIRPAPVEEKKGGVYIPDSGKSKSSRGEVLLVGPGDVRNEEIQPWDSPNVGSDVLYVSDSETAANVELLDPVLIVARKEDVIGEFAKEAALAG